MAYSDDNLWRYFAAAFFGILALIFIARALFSGPKLDYVPLPSSKAKLADEGVPWYLRPLYSRGSYSPRLTMAWQAFYFTCFLAWKVVQALTSPTGTSTALTQNAALIVQLIFGFIGLVASLIGMGTFQKVKLGDTTPSLGEIEANSSSSPTNGTTSA